MLLVGLLGLLYFACIAIFASFSVTPFTALILLSLTSLLNVIFQCFLDAPDVAITEASINFIFSGILFAVVAKHVNYGSDTTKAGFKIGTKLIWHAIVIIIIGIITWEVILMLEPSNAFLSMPDVYHAYMDQSHVPNAVTAILAYYRAFDTFGETFIIALVSIGIFTIVSLDTKKSIA